MDTTGTIASFTPSPRTRFTIGGDSYEVQGAGRSYSLSSPDAQTLQFQLKPGDYAWFDSSSVDRDEVAADPLIKPGTPIGIDYQFMVQPNGSDGSFTNTASWFVVGEMHNDDLALGSSVHTSPPFAMQLDGNHLQLVARYALPGGNPSNGSPDLHMLTLWTDPNPIVPGQYYNIDIQANVSNTSAGYLSLSVNGTKVVNYSGPLGYGAPTYWEEGLYRNAGPTQTVTADFRNLTLVTGSTAVGWTGVGSKSIPPVTTPPVTTPPVSSTPLPAPIQPAVTKATASPGTGTEAAGSTITLSLAFNEAVKVTGTPTLKLNDGSTATYVSGSGTSSLTFRTTVASTNTATSALAITGVNLPTGTSIKNLSGVAASLSGAVKTFTGLKIDPTTPPAVTTPPPVVTKPPPVVTTTLPAVTKATAVPGTGTALVGNTVTLTLAFNKAVTVTGKPTLSLNDGGIATYLSGSGTGTLTFRTTIASNNTAHSALAITKVNLPSGASIKDSSGVAAKLSGAVKTFTGLKVDPTDPAVASVTALPKTGTEVVGNTITLALRFWETMKVTGTPTLALNDGGTATYVGGSGTNVLTFRTTVKSTDKSTSALAITGVNLPNGASIKDLLGTPAHLWGAVKTFPGLAVKTSTGLMAANALSVTSATSPTSPLPVLTIADKTLTVTEGGGTVGLGTHVSTTDPHDVVTVNIKGLPSYETITDKLDGRTFSGTNVTLTAAEVNSGLTLHSYYRGSGTPVATLTLTATGKDSVTGTVASSASQTIAVTDPAPTTAPGPTSSLVNHGFALLNQHLASNTGRLDHGQIEAAISHGEGFAHDGVLTRPQH
ncbi:heparin lyase I family protein [Bradyrhizobium jicamae]|uniref:Heparin lyase I family protein n=1 Tax=Bradyrhizobium jicamae TaxID=280332 RepID=A0ABS5FGQ1_9BRAD|nr:heparin lyase I family protein [Bradyrhizobium jicamae]MBR0795965.1 heparin lyase I family protein [Bradyrhizobium jicamae]